MKTSKLKTGIFVLLIGIALSTGTVSAFSVWATSAIEASKFVSDAGLVCTVAIGLDDKNESYHKSMKETKPYPNIEKQWTVNFGRHQYAGYSGYKLNFVLGSLSDDDELETQCEKGMHAHAWIRPWGMGEHVTCV